MSKRGPIRRSDDPEVLADYYLRTIGNVRRRSAARDDPFEARFR